MARKTMHVKPCTPTDGEALTTATQGGKLAISMMDVTNPVLGRH